MGVVACDAESEYTVRAGGALVHECGGYCAPLLRALKESLDLGRRIEWDWRMGVEVISGLVSKKRGMGYVRTTASVTDVLPPFSCLISCFFLSISPVPRRSLIVSLYWEDQVG